tara:strand:+ start:362 stop:1153 length:792 start_codon:yes stop_codon:yes gene_type:complete
MALVYQLDASVAGSLWADDAKTTAATDGGVVAVWSPNASGSVTTDAIQTTNTKRPLYRSNYSSSGYAAIEFDGSNDLLTVAHSTSFNSSVYDMFLVWTPVAIGSGDTMIFGKITNSGWNDGVSMCHSGALVYAGAPNYSDISITSVLSNGLKTMAAVKLKAADRSYLAVRSDNIIFPTRSTLATAPATTSTAVLNIGGPGTAGGGNFTNSAIHELRIYTGEETLSTRLSVYAELAKKWGLTTLSTVPSSGGLIGGGNLNGGFL